MALMPDQQTSWQGLGLAEPWLSVASKLSGNSAPRAVQAEAITAGLLSSRKNLLISAPTNAGKSLVGTLALLQALTKGQRAVLLEPLRALAREQAEALERVAPMLREALGVDFNVRISTGDYRLEDEQFSEGAPAGELIVATPERFEAILRNPENADWIAAIGAVCADEAHLISNPRRGPTLEFLLTSLLTLPAPPRLVLLSATLGDVKKATEWLQPCSVVRISERYPPLKKEVCELVDDEDANEVVAARLGEILNDDDAQGLVFVYQTRSTQSLAKELTERLGKRVGENGAVAYHSKMSIAQRNEARESYLSGKSRVAVTTSALALGVNLPATHVIVRDLTYPGARSPDIADLLQMMGRAGRGDTPGYAVVLKRPSDDWRTDDLRLQLDEERLPPFNSTLTEGDTPDDSSRLRRVTELCASLLSRTNRDGLAEAEIERFFARSLGATEYVAQVMPALKLLESDTLAYEEAGKFRLTVLGDESTKAVLPSKITAGFAQLIRDFLSIDDDDRFLGQWQPIDHLIVLNLLHEGAPKLRRYSKALAEQVTNWAEASDNESMLYSQWFHGQEGHSKADQVLGSLGVSVPDDKRRTNDAERMRQRAYVTAFQSIVLLERGRGRSIDQITRQYEVKNLAGVEERWRDEMLWLLNGLSRVLEIRAFYYHLREECGANDERIRRVKRLFGRMRHQTYELQEQLKYCSPLGPALRDIRQVAGGGVGVQTIRKLEEAGIQDLKSLYQLGLEGMLVHGVRRDIARRIQLYLQRRMA